jgi:hypothetical protein
VIAVLVAVALLLIVGLLARRTLETDWARRSASSWLERAAGRAGVQLQVEELRWGYLPLRILLDGVTVEVSGVHADIDRLELDLARIRIARRTLELGTVAVRGARVRLEGPPEGRQRPRRESSQLQLSVRHLDLRDISFEGSQLARGLDLELNGVAAAWVTEDEVPHGFLTVDHGQLRVRGMEAIDLEIRSRIEARDGIQLPRWRVRGDGILLTGRGRISASEGLRLAVDGKVDLSRLDHVVRARARLAGTVGIAAVVDSSRRELVQLEIDGRRIEAAGFPIDNARARMVVERDAIHGSLERAEFHGGRISGEYRLAHFRGPTRPHSVRLQGEGVSLTGFLGDLRVPDAGLEAAVDIDAHIAWNGRAIREANGRGTAVFEPAESGTPVSGRLDCDITPEGLLRFSGEDLNLGSSVVDWQGPLVMGSWEPAWSINASPAVLEEVIPMVNGWIGQDILPTTVTGIADLQVTLNGPWKSLVVSTRIDAEPISMAPIQLDRLVAEARIAGSSLNLDTSRFSVDDGHGEIGGKVAWGPDAGGEQLDLKIRGHRIPMRRIAAWIGQEGQADGALSFTGGLRGPVASPRGSWAVGVDDAELIGRELGDGSATVDLARGRFDANAVMFEGGLQGSLFWAVPDGEVGGDLEWLAMPIGALDDASARLLGSTADFRLRFRLPREGTVFGRIEAVSSRARFIADSDDSGVRIDASLADAAVADAVLERTEGGGLAGTGELRLESAEGLLSQLFPDSGLPLRGRARAGLQLRWPSGGLPTINGLLDELDLRLDDRPLRLISPAPFEISAQGLDIDGIHLGVADDELFARWEIAANGALEGNLSGTMDALLLRFVLPDWEPAGRITGVVELLGTVDQPLFEGIAEIYQGSFRLPKTRTILSGIDGTVLLSSDEMVLEGVDFRFMQGSGRCAGTVALRDGRVHLGLDGTMSALRYEIFTGLTADLSGAWRLEGPVDELALSGDITVDRATLRRKDDVATLLLDWFGASSPPSGDEGLQLSLHVEADETIEVRNPFVRLVGSASLDITGTTTQPGILGKLEFQEGGEINLQTVRYEIERGSLTFSDPTSVEPLIELQATTWVQNYQITVRLTGTPDRLVPSVASNPPLSEGEIYSLLAIGYRDEALGAGAMGVGLASTVLTRAIASELDRRARTLLPVDQIRVDPFAETSTGNPTARISVVKQLSPTWTFIVQSNLSAEREEVVVSRWYLAPGLFIEASRDIDGSYGMDLKLRRPY